MLRGLDELRPGDVVFCARPSALQWLAESVGGEFRHCGVVADIDGERSIVESSLFGLLTRPVTELPDAYQRIGIARPSPEVGERLAAGARDAVDCPFGFPVRMLPGLGLAAIARRGRRDPSLFWVRWLIRWSESIEHKNDRMSCAGFVIRLIGPDRVPRRGDTLDSVALPAKGALLRGLLALAMPTDIWWLPMFEQRFEIHANVRPPVGLKVYWS